MNEKNKQEQKPENNQQQQPQKNFEDIVRELRDENAARRVENNDLKTLLTSIKDLLQKGQAPDPQPDLKTEKGKQMSDEMKQALEGYSQRIEAAEKAAGELAALKEQLEAEKKAREASEFTALKVRTAAKYKLPDALADRLQGSTPEELEEDAKRLATLVSPGQKILGNAGAGEPPSVAKQLFDMARGGPTNPFDPKAYPGRLNEE